MSANSGRFLLILVFVGRSCPNTGRIWTHIVLSRAEIGGNWPKSAQHLSNSAQVWSTPGQVGRVWSKLPKFQHMWPRVSLPPISAEFETSSAKFGPTQVGKIRPTNRMARVHKTGQALHICTAFGADGVLATTCLGHTANIRAACASAHGGKLRDSGSLLEVEPAWKHGQFGQEKQRRL